jgi:hypothetical protein
MELMMPNRTNSCEPNAQPAITAGEGRSQAWTSRDWPAGVTNVHPGGLVGGFSRPLSQSELGNSGGGKVPCRSLLPVAALNLTRPLPRSSLESILQLVCAKHCPNHDAHLRYCCRLSQSSRHVKPHRVWVLDMPH